MPRPTDTISAYGKKSGGSYDYGGWVICYPDGSTKQLTSQPGVQYGGTYDFDRVVKATGVEHWIRKGGYWIPDPKGKSDKRPCCKGVSTNERWSHHGPCEQAIKEDGLCGTHLRQISESKRKDDEWKAKQARSDSGKRIAQDGVDALEKRGIKAGVHYHSAHKFEDSGYTGKVTVHAEDLLALLRRLDHLEEVHGYEAGL